MARNYGHQLFIACDQLVNALLAGWADETLSARAYRLGHLDQRLEIVGRWLIAWRVIDWLFIPQDWWVRWRGQWSGARHCERAYWAEKEMKQNAPEYRPENVDEPARI